MFGTANLRLLSSALLVGLSLVTPQADASAATLTFNQLPNSVDIENYFNGGLSSYAPAGTGPAYGVAFSNNAEELKQGFNGNAPSGGTGKFENNPSGANGILYFAFSNSTTSYLNVPGGFTGLTLGYSLLNNSSAYDLRSSYSRDLMGPVLCLPRCCLLRPALRSPALLHPRPQPTVLRRRMNSAPGPPRRSAGLEWLNLSISAR
jgi:hypothetical protein